MYMRELNHEVLTGSRHAVVQTEAGAVRGAIVEGSYVFRGIPYAEAKRFQPPQRVSHWDGVRKALHFGFSSPELSTPIAADADRVPRYYFPQGEDCLNLNIWTQSIRPDALQPVVVSLYGNSWASGAANELWANDGEELSAFGNVVFVAVNHRLGPLGFLDLGDFSEAYRESANAGLLDLVAALRWIRDNIASFGGDPHNVTLHGIAAGADKVLALMQTPAADGLFHRVALQGSALSASVQPENSGREIARLTLQQLHIESDCVRRLEVVSFYDLKTAVCRAIAQWEKAHQQCFVWEPQVDGTSYLGHPLRCGFRSQSLPIPMLLGSTFSEYQSSRHSFTGNISALQDDFSRAYSDKPATDLCFIDSCVRPQMLRFAKERTAAGASACYVWLFSLATSWNGRTTAWHNAAAAYMLHNAQYVEASYMPEITDSLQTQMAAALVHFAQCGNPNHELLPHWPSISADCVPTMQFDQICSLRIDYDAVLLQHLLAATVAEGQGETNERKD